MDGPAALLITYCGDPAINAFEVFAIGVGIIYSNPILDLFFY